MTDINEILARCVVRVQFERGESNVLPSKCYDCAGYRSEAIKRDCEDYKPYLMRYRRQKKEENDEYD